MNIGFIGLGAMGSAVAANLLRAGHHVRAWNRSPGPAQALAAQGAEAVATPAEAFRAEVVFSMLADDAALRAVLLDSSVLDQAPKDAVHTNLSTISAVFAEELAKRHDMRGIAYVAAPVLGRPDVAAAGKLNILAAGATQAIDRIQPLLDAIGQKTWRLGDVPAHANVVKLAANFLLVSAVEAIGESAALVSAYGVAPADLLDVVAGSILPGPVYQGYGKLIVDSRYEPPGFKAALALKDMRLASAAADAATAALPLLSLVRDSLLESVAHGDGDKDLAVLGETAARRAGRHRGR